MRQSLPILALPILALLLLLAAGSAHAQSDLLFASGFETGSATVGPAGGLVPGPDGVRLIVDEGSLSSAVTFRIAADATGAPPLPSGIELAGSIYAVTPHGTGFDATAVVELPVPAGSGPLFLVKGEPGNPRWSVIAQAGAPGPVLRSGVESLSYFALGRCSPTLPAGVCPAGHTLSLELLDGSNIQIPVDYDNPQPVLLVTTPTLLTFRMRWTRPPFTQRTDTIDTGNANQSGVLGRTAGFAFEPAAPRFEQVSGNVDRIFSVTVTPALVDGAADPMRGGTVRRIWAQASYANVDPPFPQAWDFDTFIPIRVYDPTGATAPFEITSQPQNLTVPIGQPATFTVATNTPPASFLTYYWFRAAGASGPFSPIANARAASYTTPPTTPADNGARFRVQVCSTRPLRCVLSNIATLGGGAPLPPSITQQPVNAAVTAGATASFTVLAQADQSLQIAWERSNDGGASWIAAGPGVPITDGSRLDIATQLTDDGALFRAEACNVAGAVRTCVDTNAAELSVSPAAQPGWTAPAVVLDWGTNIDTPHAEPLLERAVVNANGSLLLLQRGTNPAVLATGIAGRPFVATRSQVYQYVLFSDNVMGSTCGAFAGNRLNVIGLWRDTEGNIAIAPRRVLFESGACIFGVTAGGALPGVAFAMTLSTGGPPRVGRFDLTYDRNTLAWTMPPVSTEVLAISPECGGQSILSERGLAGPSSVTLPGPARAGVLAYESNNGAEAFACAATLSAEGIWSTARTVRPLGAVGVSTGHVMVAMDASANTVLVANRLSAGQRALSTLSLAATASDWVQESEFNLFTAAQPDLGASPLDGRVLLAWRNPPTAMSTFTTVYAVFRETAGTWGLAQRLLASNVDTRFPRVTMGALGEHLVTFPAIDNARFRAMGARWADGQWQPAGWIQPPDGPAAGFVVAPRYWFLGTAFDGLEFMPVFWRETDPGDPTRFRIIGVTPGF